MKNQVGKKTTQYEKLSKSLATSTEARMTVIYTIEAKSILSHMNQILGPTSTWSWGFRPKKRTHKRSKFAHEFWTNLMLKNNAVATMKKPTPT